jgi:hypothetical protein
LVAKSSIDGAAVADGERTKEHLEVALGGIAVAGALDNTSGYSVVVETPARRTFCVVHVRMEMQQTLESSIAEYDRLGGMGATSARRP